MPTSQLPLAMFSMISTSLLKIRAFSTQPRAIFVVSSSPFTAIIDRTAAIFQGAYDAAVAIWGSLPRAIGDFAFQAANGLISGVEAMLNGVVTRINNFISGINAALAMLPEWAVGEGGAQIGLLDPFSIGRIDNPFEGSTSEAGSAAAEAFSAAWGRTYIETPDLFGDLADQAVGAPGWDFPKEEAILSVLSPAGDTRRELRDELPRDSAIHHGQ